MQLVINTYGAYLRKRDNCFLIKVEDNSQEVSVKKVQSILITTGVLISSDALQMAIENNIDVVFMDKYGDPFGRLWHSKLGSTTLIRRKQLESSCSCDGMELLQSWIDQRLETQIIFLKKLREKRPENDKLLESANRINDFKIKISQLSGTIDSNRGTIQGLEGNACKAYYEALSSVMPDKYQV
jgi:CRISP-associated protein Cas1